jgi:hypothetical protein
MWIQGAMRALILPTAGLLAVAACAHRAPVRLEVTSSDTEAYRSIVLDGAFEVEIEVGGPPSVELRGDEDAVDRVQVHTLGDHLYLDAERRPLEGEIRARITTPALERVDIVGAADLRLSGLSGGTLTVNLSGAGSADVRGEVEALDLEISGAGSFDAVELVAQRVHVRLSGAGSAEVHATEELHADVSGVGSIAYAGSPASVSKNVSGVGSIEALD